MTPAAELDSILARLCLFREARGESLTGKAAVLSVLRNRANDPKNRWPKTLAGVVLQKNQFSSFNATDPNVTTFPLPSHPADFQAWVDCGVVYDAPLTASSVGNSQFYVDITADLNRFAVSILGHGKTAADLEACKTAQIGRLIFFALP